MIKTVKDIDLKGKRVIMRVDFNVPMKEGVVQDDTRIQAALPTIKYILEQSPRSLVLMSHLGDPKKDVKKAKEKAEKAGKTFTAADEEAFINGKNRMKPVSEYLAKVLGKDVAFAEASFGQKAVVDALPEGGVLMLENTRFNPEETSKDVEEQKKLAQELATYGDVYVNDAFGTAHRKHASTAVVAEYFDADNKMVGLLMEKELNAVDNILTNINRPFTAIMGGSKVSTKIGIIENLMEKVDNLILCGGMTYTFMKALGGKIGNSICEDDKLQLALDIIAKAKEKGVNLVLGVDSVCGDKFSIDANTMECPANDIPDGWEGLDIGPKTCEIFANAIKDAKTILWNGPAGVFEFDTFAVGSKAVADAVVEATANGAFSLVGGGDSVACVNKFGYADKVSYVSTGGGALLEAIEGKVLPGVAAIKG